MQMRRAVFISAPKLLTTTTNFPLLFDILIGIQKKKIVKKKEIFKLPVFILSKHSIEMDKKFKFLIFEVSVCLFFEFFGEEFFWNVVT